MPEYPLRSALFMGFSRYIHLCRIFFCTVVVCVLVCPSVCHPASVSEIKKNIVLEKKRASEKSVALRALSKKERGVFRDLAQVEDKVRALEKQVKSREEGVADLARQEEVLRKKHQATLEKTDRLRRDAEYLLRTLWPVFMDSQSNKHFDTANSWATAEREATWLSFLYGETGDKLLEVREAGKQTLETLERLQETRKEREEQIAKITELQDDLLQQKLSFLKHVQKIRSQELDLKEQLAAIEETISGLHYTLQLKDTHSFPKLKGHIPWPAKGRLVKGFRPKDTPPHRGLSLALAANQQISAVSWGKVVYDDQLRGFGQVIIIYHGKDYYSLYAFLAKSYVRVGQKVEKGEPLGECGFYPLLKGTGLYFELRFHKKAISPLQWLQSLG